MYFDPWFSVGGSVREVIEYLGALIGKSTTQKKFGGFKGLQQQQAAYSFDFIHCFEILII